MAFSPFGDPVFGLAHAEVNSYTSTGVYGASPVDVMSVQMVQSGLRIQSGENNGDDQITAIASRVLAGTYQVRFSGAPIEVLSIITGVASASSLSSPNRVRRLRIAGGQRMPYFGLIGQGLAEEGVGDQLIFGPKLKVTSDITMSMNEFGSFQTLEFTAVGISDATLGIFNMIQRETTGAFVWPPANIGTL